ncbi:MAG: hypothetical protein AAGA93_10470 [Actinomycetota bacterium]
MEPNDQQAATRLDGDQPMNDLWVADHDPVAADVDCSPTKVCRNARDFTFDGIADGDEDLATSWRQLLQREGKFSSDQPSIRELVLGQPNGAVE